MCNKNATSAPILKGMATQTTHTICIIDDEAPLRDVVRRYLEHDGFNVIETAPHALLLLDVMLPGIDGFGLMRILRTAGASPSLTTASSVPVIMLTSRGDENDPIAGFALGVDDYVTKPFSPRELVARIKAVLRRIYSESEKSERPLEYGALLIDPIRRIAHHADHSPHRCAISSRTR